jgi:hypothetical protein
VRWASRSIRPSVRKREADAQLAAGEGETFESGEEFLEALQALTKPATRRRSRR